MNAVFLVLHFHQFVAKVTFKEVKIETVHRNELRQEHGFEAILACQIVAEHEAASFARVGMQVNVKAYLAVVDLLLDHLFHGPYGRLFLF